MRFAIRLFSEGNFIILPKLYTHMILKKIITNTNSPSQDLLKRLIGTVVIKFI